jgi:hypothetical protein
MVPWDVYMPRDAPRYFGQPEQYADLFGFIRANARYLDGYEQAEASGCGVPVEQQAEAAAVRVIGNENVLVNVRAVPGNTEAPVVIHLVDWSQKPAPFELVLNPLRFFGDRPLQARLLRPAPYEPAAHQAADARRDYAALSQELPLAEGRTVSFQIPALQPWGLVVVQAASEAEAGIWQPTIGAEPESFYAERLTVRIECASPEAVIRYTLDGSRPGEDSPTYEEPFQLTSSAEIKAVACGVSEQSRIASASFSQVDGPELLPSPDARELSDALQLWLSADALQDDLSDGQAVDRWHASAGPSAVVPPGKLPDGRVPAAPVFRSQSLGGGPAVQFDGADDQLAVPGFANEHLAGSAFTIFLVTQSSAGGFGICGNGLTGSGGAPRLYLTRETFRYDDLHKGLAPRVPDGAAAIATYSHDGRETISAWVNGEFCGQQDGLPAVPAFGGGNLAMPFWGGNRPSAGEIAEIIVYDRYLTENERRSVEVYLASKYQLPVRRWR